MGDDHDWGTFDYEPHVSIFESIKQNEKLAKENAEKLASTPWWKVQHG
jgi:hypothetical protein